MVIVLSQEINAPSYLLPDGALLNRWNNKTYDLQYTTRKIKIDCRSMHCSINMLYYKHLYPYKYINLTYFVYDDNCFDSV